MQSTCFSMKALSANDILRMHPMRRNRHAKSQREAIAWRLKAAKLQAPQIPAAPGRLQITLTRIAPGTRPLDDDNLAGGFKAMRDGVADWLGVDDGSPRLAWAYAQKRSADGVHRVEVAFEVLP